ncbi:MAG: hypothetical protein K2M34_01890 [Alphaproteobacteria bacterium]|nr:hypothetical protein [Alphaproteobacteria bacterium]
MKVLNKIIPYKIRRALPILGIAAGSMFMSSCSNDEPTPLHDEEIVFYEDTDVTFDILEKLAADPSIRNIYLIPPQNDRFGTFEPENVSASRKFFWEPRFNISSKIKGRGDMRIKPGSAAQVPEDSLWYLSKGWTINQYLQKQK